MVFLDSLQGEQSFNFQDFATKMYQWSDEAFQRLGLITAYQPGVGKLNVSEQGFSAVTRIDPTPQAEIQPSPIEIGGNGQLVFSGKAVNDRSSVNPRLIADLQRAAALAGVKIQITTAVTGHRLHTTSGNISRHSVGNAVDIALINDTAANTNNPAGARYADAVVAALIALGYTHSGFEAGLDRVVIWRSSQHFNHIHVSNRNR